MGMVLSVKRDVAEHGKLYSLARAISSRQGALPSDFVLAMQLLSK